MSTVNSVWWKQGVNLFSVLSYILISPKKSYLKKKSVLLPALGMAGLVGAAFQGTVRHRPGGTNRPPTAHPGQAAPCGPNVAGAWGRGPDGHPETQLCQLCTWAHPQTGGQVVTSRTPFTCPRPPSYRCS